MIKFLKTLFVAIGIVVLIASSVLANEHFTTDDMGIVYNKAQELSKKYSTSEILIVFDNDNTLLAMCHPLGSEQWFTWQEELIKSNISKDTVSNNFQGLVDVQGLLFSLETMKPVQKETPKIIQDLMKNGFKLMVLTSRSEEFMYSTLRELLNNGMDIRKSAILPIDSFKVHFPIPYDTMKMKKIYAFNDEEIVKYRLNKTPIDINYTYGVAFTTGQHKGAMLRILLKETKYNPKAIIFIDDKEKHIERIEDAFKESNIEVVTYRYSREDRKVEDFVQNEAQETTYKWEKLQDAYRGGDTRKIDKIIRKYFKSCR